MTLTQCLAVTLTLLGAGLACDDVGALPTTLIQRVYTYPITLYGRVLSKTDDPRHDYGTGTSVYDVELEVFCIIKGEGGIGSTVTIKEGGVIPGLCHSTHFTIGQDYIVFVRVDDGDSGPTYHFDDVQMDADDDNLRLVTRVCDIEPRRPDEADPSNPECPMPVNPGQCIHDMNDEHGHDHEHYDDMDHHDDHGDHHDHDHDHEDHEGHDHPGNDPHDHDHDGVADHAHGDHDDHMHGDHHDHEDHDDHHDHTHEDHEGHDHPGNDPHDHDHDGAADHSHDDHGAGMRCYGNVWAFVLALLAVTWL